MIMHYCIVNYCSLGQRAS
uniref:Uncharacterized protein n=1 Tax=Arundo donax TaxID=35708 RepID=A0A0A9Q3C8_ARUDO